MLPARDFTHSVKHEFDHIYSHNNEQFATPAVES